MLNICLVEPEIPQNTGNIARTAAATGTTLHLVHPLGFSIDEKAVRHAGLDYWKDVKIIEHESKERFYDFIKDKNFSLYTTKAQKLYTEEDYKKEGDWYLVFGKESKGLDEERLLEFRDHAVRIPMIGETRSLNLSNAVSIGVYEWYRQNDFKGFKIIGELHRLKWE